jgi:hypothetical protein
MQVGDLVKTKRCGPHKPVGMIVGMWWANSPWAKRTKAQAFTVRFLSNNAEMNVLEADLEVISASR